MPISRHGLNGVKIPHHWELRLHQRTHPALTLKGLPWEGSQTLPRPGSARQSHREHARYEPSIVFLGAGVVG